MPVWAHLVSPHPIEVRLSPLGCFILPGGCLHQDLKDIHLDVSCASGAPTYLSPVTRDERWHPEHQTVLSGPWQLLVMGTVVSPEGSPVWGGPWAPTASAVLCESRML